MRNIVKTFAATALLASLSACVVAPPAPVYVEPGVTVIRPAPYYGPVYHPYPHHYHGGWGHRW